MALDLDALDPGSDELADASRTTPASRAPWPGLAPTRIPLDDLVLLTRQLALLLLTGNTLVPSVGALGREFQTPVTREVLADVHGRLEEGRPFSECLARHPRHFDTFFVSIVRAGEATGALRTSLERLSEVLETRRAVRARIREAMTYPLILLVIMGGVLSFTLVYVLPKFVAVFDGMGADLPLPTRMLLGASDFLGSRWLLLAPIPILVGMLLRWLDRRPEVRRHRDRLLLSLPIVGPLVSEAYLFQMFLSLGLLLQTRVPLLDAIEITRGTVANTTYARFFRTLAEHVEDGRGMTDAFREARFLPEAVKLMIATGESSGALDVVFGRLSERYRADLDHDIRRLGAAIEPVMLVVMGILVGGVAISLILPLFRLSGAIR